MGAEGTIEIDEEFVAGLCDIEGFSHIIVLYHLHLVTGHELAVVPFLDAAAHGIFATRSPKRPNPIGLSVYRLLGITGTTVRIGDVDAVDGSPVLDIKPFVPAFDAPAVERIGCFRDRLANLKTARADDRFT